MEGEPINAVISTLMGYVYNFTAIIAFVIIFRFFEVLSPLVYEGLKDAYKRRMV